MAHDVFICHSAKDKTTADAVCAMLESNGLRCWIAPRDVTAGMEWSECIIDAIEECRVMVLVFTTNANESSQIRREVERAVNRGVAILPLRIEDILPGRALEYFIGNVHWLDAMTPPLESHLHNLAGTVKILLGRLPQHVAPIPHAGTIPPVVQAAAPAPPKVEWVEPPRAREVEPSAPEVLRTPPAFRPEPPQVISVPAPPPEPIRQQPVEIHETTKTTPPVAQAPLPRVAPAVAAPEKSKRPMSVTVIAALNFLFAGFMIFTLFAANSYQRHRFGVAFLPLAIAAATTGYGLFTLKKWGRLIGIVLPSIGVVWLIALFDEASRQADDFHIWLALLAFFGGVICIMFTPTVGRTFSVPRQGAGNFGSIASAASTPRNFSSALFARGTGPLPRPVLVIAILSFIEAGIWTIPIVGDYNHDRLEARDFGAILLACAAAAIGFGLIRLMGSARWLKVAVAVVDAVLMISVAQDAFHEGGFGELSWIGIFIFVIWSALYMFTPQVKRAFSKAV